MGLIIDTCIFIRAEKLDLSSDLSIWNTEEEICMSVITVSELLIGVHSANTEARRLKRSAFVESIISVVPILHFDANIARTHAEIYAYLSKKGQMIGAHDLIICATALAHGHAILTSNESEFKRVPGLNIKILSPTVK